MVQSGGISKTQTSFTISDADLKAAAMKQQAYLEAQVAGTISGTVDDLGRKKGQRRPANPS